MDPSFAPDSAASMMCTKVEISVQCRNLKNKDATSKSHPMCVLFFDSKTQPKRELGRTEVIKDTLDPDFVKKFTVDYFFEERQLLVFSIYDVNSKSSNLENHELLGEFRCSLGELVSAKGSTTEKALTGARQGKIIVRVEEVTTIRDEVTMELKATKLDKKDLFGKSDPFLLLYRVNEDNSYTVAHKTEVVRKNLNPEWKQFTIPVQTLCNGDYDRSIKIECYDWDSDGSHDFIGSFTTNLHELTQSAAGANAFPVINENKLKKKNYKDSGQIHVESISIQQRQSFLDYICGGMQMKFAVAIDFTQSNGAPHLPTSLHHWDGHNQYTAAIQAVGEIIQDYDSDKKFPVLGFGAKVPGIGVSHEFAVNLMPDNPFCEGVGGILAAYHSCLPKIELAGPTNFAPVINHVARIARENRNGSCYYVLLIITDGVISDVSQTKNAIVAASSLPMSIIIVGVGDAEFEAMDILDSDNCLLTNSKGEKAERDVVQFVSYKDIDDKYSNVELSKAELAKDVLAEVPEQVLQFLRKHKVKAKAPSAIASAPPPTAPC